MIYKKKKIYIYIDDLQKKNICIYREMIFDKLRKEREQAYKYIDDI